MCIVCVRVCALGFLSEASLPWIVEAPHMKTMDLAFAELKFDDRFPGGDLPFPPSAAVRPDLLHDFEQPPDSPLLVQFLIELVNDVSSIGDFRRIFKIECANLTRRVKLLAPLFEEVKEFKGSLPEQAVASFTVLRRALQAARDLLRLCHNSSKIYLVLQREAVVNKFLSVTAELEQALDIVPFSMLDISDEVREQVELVHAQLKRAKGRADAQDLGLFSDLAVVLSQDNASADTNAALERLAEKLQLKTLSELEQESQALSSIPSGKPGDKKEMSELLRQLQELAKRDNALMVVTDHERNAQMEKLGSPVIPDDFRCPISLELMKDPVIVATGQTYERSCIQKWLDAGNKTCPKTQQVLPHLILTPNYVLKSLIAQWCETHGIELPKKIASGDRQTIEVLLQKLSHGQPDVQRAAAGELRLLAKRNAENRVCIAEAGAIPRLVGLLSSKDERTQEHAVTALLNLSIHESNKGTIVTAGAIDPIVEVLKNGSMEARENAAATLFSLSVVDENKVTIGGSGAIPALVSLLRDGTLRGKKDAATALFNLSIYQGNKARAVRANVVPPLMQLLADPSSEMVDEALAILAILATHQEGRLAIGQASAIPVLIELIRTGSPRNKENAAAVLLALCLNDPAQTTVVQQIGAHGPLTELAKSGTTRARRKATSLLDHLSKQEKSTTETG